MIENSNLWVQNAELEKKCKQLGEILNNFDKEVNRLFNIIKEANNFIDLNFDITQSEIAKLKSILSKTFEVNNAETI